MADGSSLSDDHRHRFDPTVEDRAIPALRLPSTDGIELPLFDLTDEFEPQPHPVLLIAHATGMSGRVYLPLADRLPELHCLAPDLRGHGDASSPRDKHYDWSGFRRDLRTVTESRTFRALSPGKVFGFGHSMGAAALIMLELERPGTFGGLFVFEPIILPPELRQGPGESPMVESARRRRGHFASREAAYRNYAGKPPLDALAPEALDAYVRYCFSTRADGSVEIKLPGPEEGSIYAMSGSHDTFDSLSRVRCPVCVARGRLEPRSASHWASRIATQLYDSKLLELDQLGHFGPLEDPDSVASAVSVFFEQLS